ncbi:MAG: Na-Ca exchanger/integrin-beta4, partial [Thermoleophilia bacterium]|nr:Na-Ca exchanger/integrin-beta4 [Thermoleophilia bacterium]
PPEPLTWSCAFPTLTADAGGPVPDGTYTVTMRATDNAGNQSNAITRTIIIDNSPPLIQLHSFTEVTNGQYSYDDLVNSRIWFNPNQSGSFNVNMDVADSPAGVNRVDFPDADGAAALWSPSGGGSQTVAGAGGRYSQPYAWTTGAAEPSLLSAVAYDNAGNFASDDFEVLADGTPPTGLTISYFDGYVVPGNAVVTYDEGTDALSGLSTTQTQLRRRSAVINPTSGACGLFTGWTTVATDPSSPFNDATAIEGASGMCYQYQLQVYDHVANTASITLPATHVMKVATPRVLVSQTGCANNVMEGPATPPCSLNVRLNTVPTGPVTITVGGGTQLIPGFTTLTFTPADWNTVQVLPVNAIDDDIDEAQPHLGDVTFTSVSVDPLYNAIVTPPQTFSITDNDVAGIIIGHTSTDTVVSEAGTPDYITVRLQSQPTANVTITGTALAGIIGPGLDVSYPSVLTFTASNWSTDQLLEVRAIDDNYAESTTPEAATLRVVATSTDPNYQALTSSPATLPATVIDNDVANVIWGSTGPFDVTEGAAGKSFTVRLDTIPTANVTINLDVRGVPVRGNQASLSHTTVTFTPLNWNTAQTITVTAVNDDIDEPDNDQEWIDVTVVSADPEYAGQPAGPFSVIVDDNDTAGITMNATAPENVTEGGVGADYTVVLDSEPSANVVIDIATALPPQVTTGTAQLTFTPANWDIPQTVTISAIDDFVAEGIHFSMVSHDVVSGDLAYDNWSLPVVNVRITDNEVASAIASRTTLNVSESGTTDAYSLRLGSKPSGDVTVVVTGDADVEPSSPSRDTDSANDSVTIVFTTLNWATPVVIIATAVDDFVAEGTPHTGTFVTTMSSASDPAYNTSGVATPLVVPDIPVNITDNDVPGIEVQATGGSTAVSEDGASDTYNVRLSSIPASPVTVRMSPDKQLRVGQATVVFDSSNWNVFQAVTVNAVDDPRVEGPHVGFVHHSLDSLDTFYDGLTADPIAVAITDNDSAGLTMVNDDGQLVVYEGGATDIVNISLNAQPSANVIVRVVGDDQVQVAGDITFTPDNWSVPQRVTLSAIDDTVAEGDHSTELQVVSYSEDQFYSGRRWNPLLVRIIDNEGLVYTQVRASSTKPLWVNRQGRTGVYAVILKQKPTSNVTIRPVASKYFTYRPKVLTFTPRNWAVQQYVRVTFKKGAGGSGQQTRTIQHTVRSTDRNYNQIKVKGVSVIITDVKPPKNYNAAISSANSGAAKPKPSKKPTKPVTKRAAPVTATLPNAPAPTLVAKLGAQQPFDRGTLVGKVFDVGIAKLPNGNTLPARRVRLTGTLAARGFTTEAQATRIVRIARSKATNRAAANTRWVVMQGLDRKYYAFTAIVARGLDVSAVDTGITFLVFADQDVTFYDEATGWVARPDNT